MVSGKSRVEGWGQGKGRGRKRRIEHKEKMRGEKGREEGWMRDVEGEWERWNERRRGKRMGGLRVLNG